MADEPLLPLADVRPRLVEQATLLGTQLDDLARQRLELIDRFGWMIIAVMGDESSPPFAYSVGLWHRFALPEVIMFGLPPEVAQSLLNDLGRRASEGERYGRDHYVHDMIEGGHRLRVDPIGPDATRHYLRVAGWFNQLFHADESFPAVQCVWPDKRGILPGERHHNGRLDHTQPLLRCEEAW